MNVVGMFGWSGKPLLSFGLLPRWAASGTGTGLSVEVAFCSQIFTFKSMGIGLLPKLQKYLENKKKTEDLNCRFSLAKIKSYFKFV